MKKKIKNYLAIMAAASIVLSGCQSSTPREGITNKWPENTIEDEKEAKIDEKEKIKASGPKYSTVADLKRKYGIEEEKEIRPLYNVPKDMKFTFKFHSLVDPYKAVTVHTDKACNVDSMVNVAYGGFSTPYGEDVLVVPNSPVLNCTDRLDYSDEPSYGYAPLYYLCIRYDMDSTDVTKLDDPIIIPFTLKGDVQTPTAYPKISMDGTFSVNWNPVSDADSYRIYEAYASSSDQERSKGTLRRENGYSGEHLRFIAEVGAGEESYSDFGSGSDSNTLVDSNGSVFVQNAFSLNNYYVTAVKDGKESFFSQEVSGWKYNSQLPKKFDSYNGFERDGLAVTKLPEKVEIEMVDGSRTMMPINYRKVDSTYESLPGGNDVATYEYEIVGTKLKGKIEYHDANGSYPESITSSAVPNYGIYQVDVSVDAVPSPEVPTINDENYGNRYVDLGKSAKYHKESMATYRADALMLRADMDAERMLLSGQYQRDPLSIDYVESFGTPMEPVYPESMGDVPAQPETETQATETSSSITIYEEETSPSSVKPEEETISEEKTDTEITASNIIEEQIDQTNRQVDKGNNEEYEVSGYPSFADTAEEEYIAEHMINRDELFSVQAFPALQDMNNLRDVILKVYYQNPYVFGFSNASYDPYSMEVMIEYSMDKEKIEERQKEIDRESDHILAQIVDGSMDQDGKVKAIYEYLEANTEYDMDALEAAEANGFQDISGFDDSFNTYGIMCKKKGVCQSYAYTVDLLCKKAGINSKMLTGYMSKTMPHAWNAVEYDGNWYWIDATNNGKTSGIPYLLYQTSSDTAEDMDYVLDDGFDLDFNLRYVENSDMSKDWYVENGLVAGSEDELIEKISSNYNGNGSFAIRHTFALEMSDAFLGKLAMELSSKGVDITEMRFGDSMNYFILVN